MLAFLFLLTTCTTTFSWPLVPNHSSTFLQQSLPAFTVQKTSAASSSAPVETRNDDIFGVRNYGREEAAPPYETIISKVDNKYDQAQGHLTNLLNRKPIVDTAKEEDKYGNDGSFSRAFGAGVVGVFQKVADVGTGALEVRFFHQFPLSSINFSFFAFDQVFPLTFINFSPLRLWFIFLLIDSSQRFSNHIIIFRVQTKVKILSAEIFTLYSVSWGPNW